MQILIRLAMAQARLAAAQTARRLAAATGLVAVALLFFGIGLIGFLAAFWIWLASVLGPIAAALVVGGAGFVLAAIFLLLARTAGRRPEKTLSPAAEQLLAELRAAKSGPVAAVLPLLAATLLGYVLASRKR